MDFKVLHFRVLDSTNTYAKQLSFPKDEAVLVLADTQTNGYGRFNRQWESSSHNNLLCTYSFHVQKDMMKPYAFLAGLALIKTCSMFAISAQLKWPNDVLVDKKKVAGVLVEQVFQENSIQVCIGIGVNIGDNVFSEHIVKKADSIQVNKHQFLKELTAQLNVVLAYPKETFEKEILNAFQWMIHLPVVVNGNQYVIRSIRPDGSITICDGENICNTLVAGDVSLTGNY